MISGSWIGVAIAWGVFKLANFLRRYMGGWGNLGEFATLEKGIMWCGGRCNHGRMIKGQPGNGGSSDDIQHITSNAKEGF